ncbi:Argonaute complex, subunit Arb1 [Tuber borchii]|uniref:Argonaute complex, subunit Arb1 n=1 Tax=Tuber borchii TaxID=42251 RepID=A0A2T6ZK41_TUBBO|nr:Argonaute complex, subunit Arb1 [Tuber borchii]
MTEPAEASLSEAVEKLEISSVGEEHEDEDVPKLGDVKITKLEEKQPPKKKKKKRNKPKNPRPSGFEEHHVEGPMTPEAALEEQSLYHPTKPFSERIELCIQRYKSKRKFDALRSQIFTTYLTLGGISTGPKQFSGGLDYKQNDHLDKEQLETMAATDFVSTSLDEDDEWEVDFPFVVRGFLSHRVPYVLGYTEVAHLELAAQVVRNFLNYIIYHNVAPEYGDSINEAIRICDMAEKELALCRHTSHRLPGNFNMACSTLFGGHYAGMKDETQTWDTLTPPIGLTIKEATDIFNACVQARGTSEQKEAGLNVEITKAEYMGMEVIGIIFPNLERKRGKDEVKAEEPEGSKANANENGNPTAKPYEATGLKALGRLLVKPWTPDDELPPETDLVEFDIWIELEVLQFCFTGMHLEAKVHRLSSGIFWIDSVTAVQCSFYIQLDPPEKAGDNASDDEFD